MPPAAGTWSDSTISWFGNSGLRKLLRGYTVAVRAPPDTASAEITPPWSYSILQPRILSGARHPVATVDERTCKRWIALGKRGQLDHCAGGAAMPGQAPSYRDPDPSPVWRT